MKKSCEDLLVGRYRATPRQSSHAHTVATARTIEQKIADAGPAQMRNNPHILTTIRAALMREGVITETRHSGAPWYYLTRKPKAEIDQRLAVLVQRRPFLMRMGQALSRFIVPSKIKSRLKLLVRSSISTITTTRPCTRRRSPHRQQVAVR